MFPSADVLAATKRLWQSFSYVMTVITDENPNGCVALVMNPQQVTLIHQS